MHEVLVNRSGGLSLPRKSVVRLTDRPDMTLDVYRGRKTTMQPNHTVMYSTNRREDVAYTRLRLQHLDLPTSRIWVKDTEPLCRLCRQTNETFEHIFFECTASNHARRYLEACMEKLGYRTVNRMDLLAPKPNTRQMWQEE